jgi:hypothetical protein
MHQLLSEIQGLLILTNMLLAFIGGVLFLTGWHMTGKPRCRAMAVAQEVSPLLARIERAVREGNQGVTVLRGRVLPNGRAYMSHGETFRLPRGVILEAGREVVLSAGAV